MSEKVIIENARGSYVYVKDQRQKKNKGPDGWGIQVIFPKDHPQLKKIKRAIDKVLVEKFGESALKKKGMYKLPLRDGDEERDGAEYEGQYFLNANSKKKRPGAVTRSNQKPDEDDWDEMGYSGCYFHVSVNFYAFEGQEGGKPGVAVGLNNIMFRKAGDRLDGSVAASNEFSSFEDEDNGSNDNWDDEL